jgi:hypothetical protein
VAENKTMRGFYLATWAQEQSLLRNLRIANKVQKELQTTFKSTVQARIPLTHVGQAIGLYRENMTGGKVLIVPGE